MVAKITTGADVYGALAYNQQKVDEGVGMVLSTHILREPTDGYFSVAGTAEDLMRWMPSHYRCEKPVIHISLNPDPKDSLSDEQLSEIADRYMDRMGWGEQPYIVFKHTDIERQHIHIVSVQVGKDGKKIKDSGRNRRSVAITEELEKEYGLHPAKGQKRSEEWRLKAVVPTEGNLKRQIATVIKPALSMYRFQTLGELRALLSLYNIGIEEVRGERAGQPYRGLLYTVLDSEGKKAEVPPLKSSLFGKDYGYDALEKLMLRSVEKIAKADAREHTRRRVAETMKNASTESVFRERLKTFRIDLFLRRNDTGRITGVTFIDHENRCVLNGSRLGKEYSANVLNDLFRESPASGGHTKQEGGKEQIFSQEESFVPQHRQPTKKTKQPENKSGKGHKI